MSQKSHGKGGGVLKIFGLSEYLLMGDGRKGYLATLERYVAYIASLDQWLATIGNNRIKRSINLKKHQLNGLVKKLVDDDDGKVKKSTTLLHGIYCILYCIKFANLRFCAKTSHLSLKL